MKIGYQGIVGSHNENAAMRFLEKMSLSSAELVPLINSENVISRLKHNDIDYGIVAVNNSIAGLVIESAEAMKCCLLEAVAYISIPVHQCLFVKDEHVFSQDIKAVASHIQALSQTKNSLQVIFKDYKSIVVENTAVAAKMLSNVDIGREVAVVCSMKAGEDYGLFLLRENIEDYQNNETIFVLLKNPEL
ncbi:hypothetical protein FACS1894217_02090 [Clostridia bacterium]|nr:hypothetical protein FACS1894217_02090 [Clostridia bacterium]